MERLLRVTGKGKISLKPDLVRLILDLEGIYKTYEEALEQSATQVGTLKDCFEKLDFERADLKTLSFNIDTEYESYKDKRDNWKRKFVGYKFRHNMKLEFKADNQLLGKVLYALAHCEITPEFRIHYSVKDTENAKNQLLAKAIEDSKTKAKVLADVAGVNLGEIQNIDYSWGEVEFVSRPMPRMMAACCEEDYANECGGSYDIDIEPDDIDVSDTVTVVWSIK